MGGRVSEFLGSFLAINNVARINMEKALPHLSEEDIDINLKKMWNNLGRNFAELRFLQAMTIDGDVVTLEGEEYLSQFKDAEKGPMTITAHFGQWELLSALYKYADVEVTAIYRAANNPLVNTEIQKYRSNPAFEWVPKGREGARAMLRALKQKRVVTTMNDQKLNNGMAVPFFGRDAMTATAIAEFAVKLKVPIIPVRVERLADMKFKIIVSPPIYATSSENRLEDVKAVLTALNKEYERWISARPDQWLWVHNRWPKS